jgi:hypothetical protein
LAKDKIIPLRINEKKFRIIEDFASQQGLAVNTYLNSVVDSYVEWDIRVKSFDPVTVPKKMQGTIFALVNRADLDQLTKQWATEAKNIVLLSGDGLTLESAVSFSRLIAKHFMGSDTRVSKSEDGKTIMLIIRHDGGNGFSFFCSRWLL